MPYVPMSYQLASFHGQQCSEAINHIGTDHGGDCFFFLAPILVFPFDCVAKLTVARTGEKMDAIRFFV